MPEIQELIEKYARSKSPDDYHEIVSAVQTAAKLWTAYSPVTKCHYTEYIRNQPTAFLFSEKTYCEAFKEHIAKGNAVIETELCKADSRIQFLSDLYRCGIEQIILDNGQKFLVMSLFDIIEKPDFSALPENERPVINRELMLSANIFFESLAMGNVTENAKNNLLSGLYNGKYLVPVMVDKNTKLDGLEESTLKAVHSQSGTAVTIVSIKTDENIIIPVFTDWTEFTRFDKDRQCTGNIVNFTDIEYLCGQGEKITINPFGFNMLIDMDSLSAIKNAAGNIMPESAPVEQPYEDYAEETPVKQPHEDYAEKIPVEQSYEEKPDEPITLFELNSVPNELIQTLLYFMSNTESVHSAYLKGMEQGEQTSYLVVIDFDGNNSQFDDLTAQISQYTEGVPINFALYESELGQAAAGGAYPFYQK